MDVIIISSVTILLYIGASLLQALRLQGVLMQGKAGWLLLAFLAICMHGVLLHAWIDISAGQNLSFFNMLSLSAWLVSMLTLVVVLIKPVDVLTLFIFPFTAFTIILVLAFPGEFVINTMAMPHMLFHILVSIFTFCVLCVAGLLAILLSIQERWLRRNPSGWMISHLPPLETMENLLFQIVGLGFLLLSVVLVTSIYIFHAILWQHYLLIQKTILVSAAWVIFAILLVGRYQRGWRGRKAIYGTLFGVMLLLLAYIGSKLVLEVLT